VGLGVDRVVVVVDDVDLVVVEYALTPLGAMASPVVVLLHAVRSAAADSTTKTLGLMFTDPSVKPWAACPEHQL
jgi:hypothetical protein